MNNKSIENKFAKIETCIFDQGGFSSCSNCKATLSKYLENYFSFDSNKRKETGLEPYASLSEFLMRTEMQCPECNSYLSFGEIRIQEGGSDF